MSITITFQEGTEAPVTMTLSDETAGLLDRFVADQTNGTDEDGNDIPKYSGKADLFLKHTVASLLEPIAKTYSEDLPDVKTLEDEKEALEAQISALRSSNITPTLT